MNFLSCLSSLPQGVIGELFCKLYLSTTFFFGSLKNSEVHKRKKKKNTKKNNQRKMKKSKNQPTTVRFFLEEMHSFSVAQFLLLINKIVLFLLGLTLLS